MHVKGSDVCAYFCIFLRLAKRFYVRFQFQGKLYSELARWSLCIVKNETYLFILYSMIREWQSKHLFNGEGQKYEVWEINLLMARRCISGPVLRDRHLESPQSPFHCPSAVRRTIVVRKHVAPSPLERDCVFLFSSLSSLSSGFETRPTSDSPLILHSTPLPIAVDSRKCCPQLM